MGLQNGVELGNRFIEAQIVKSFLFGRGHGPLQVLHGGRNGAGKMSLEDRGIDEKISPQNFF